MGSKRMRSSRIELDLADTSIAAKRGTLRDSHCWLCHKNHANIPCSTCVRAYHSDCLGSKATKNLGSAYKCEECLKLESANSSAASKFNDTSLNRLLKFIMQRLLGDSEFIRFSPDYLVNKQKESAAFVIANGLDLHSIEEKVDNLKYKSTVDFLNDIKWIRHNVSIVAADNSDDLRVAKRMENFCRKEIYDIEMCHECFDRSNSMAGWFTKVCDPPHLLVWARIDGHHQYAPAKVLGLATANRKKIDVRFFHDHVMAKISVADCYLYSHQNPNVKLDEKTKLQLMASLEEVQQYLDNIRAKFSGAVVKFEPKTQFELTKISQYLTSMVPGLKISSHFKLTAKPTFLAKSVARRISAASSSSAKAMTSNAATLDTTSEMTLPETPPETPGETTSETILDLTSYTATVVLENCNHMLTDEHLEQSTAMESGDSGSGSVTNDHDEPEAPDEDDGNSSAALTNHQQNENRNESDISTESEPNSHGHSEINSAKNVTENRLPLNKSDIDDDDDDLPLITIVNMAKTKKASNTNDQCEGPMSDVELSAPVLVAREDHHHGIKDTAASSSKSKHVENEEILNGTESNSNEVTSTEHQTNQISSTESNSSEANEQIEGEDEDEDEDVTLMPNQPQSSVNVDQGQLSGNECNSSTPAAEIFAELNSNESDSGNTTTQMDTNNASPSDSQNHLADGEDATTEINEWDLQMKTVHNMIAKLQNDYKIANTKLKKETQATMKLSEQNKMLETEVETLKAKILLMQIELDKSKQNQEERIQNANESQNDAIKIQCWCCNCKKLLPFKSICSDCSQILAKSTWENGGQSAGSSTIHVEVQTENETDSLNAEINDQLLADLEGY